MKRPFLINTNSPHRIGSIMKITKEELTIREPEAKAVDYPFGNAYNLFNKLSTINR